MDTVDDLAIKPFREVVEKGKLAIENAGDSQDMMKEALRLVKVGERCLTRIESTCRKLYNEYGTNFIIALKENEDLTKYRTQLTTLLWDFEDYIEADTFDAEKFQELQALNREAAPQIYNILITMKLEVPAHFFSHLSPPSSPNSHSTSLASELNPQNHFGLLSSTSGSLSGSQGDATSVKDSPRPDDATARLRNPTSNRHSLGSQSHVPDDAYVVAEENGTSTSMPSEQLLQTPPRPPSLDPWDPTLAIDCQETEMDAYGPMALDRRLAALIPESPVDPAISPMRPDLRRTLSTSAYRTKMGVVSTCDQDTDDHSDYRYSGSSTQSHQTNATSQGSGSRPHTISSTIPVEVLPRRLGKPGFSIQQLQVRPPLPPLPPSPPPKSSERSAPSRVEDMDRQYQAIKKMQGTLRTGLMPALMEPEPAHSSDRHRSDTNSSHQDPNFQPGWSTPGSQPGLEVAVTVPVENPDHGLIPVETEDLSVKPSARLSPRDCTIGPNSTFCQYKGFCLGAQEVVRGEIGVKKTKKPGFSSAATVARCTGCFYELDFNQIEYDVNKDDRGNFHKSGINYRLRFLQKSHLPAKRVDDVLYACIFCVQAGRTIDECDATVFTTSKALFTHLARHPRPLPQIAGIAVVDGSNMPAHLRNDYDIQFLKPPEAHPAQLNLSWIWRRATGTAQDQSRKLFSQRLPYDRSPALDLCHGARVVGIEWPEKYSGEWIFAWHDGIHACAPADIIRLDAPPSEDIRMVSSSLLRGKARWKFHQKEKDKDHSLWLKFDKNEFISNISYADPEFWCWSGTNSKGKWGIFPKVFLDPSTIQELSVEGAERAMTLTNEKNKSSSMLAKFSLKRRPSVRPPSVAESFSSRETSIEYFASRLSRTNV
ncbi:hypothetical protein E4U43_001941 [Claviceps pusilla]|uniref:SH3 domain-containing protein n=1 Tax=Claviceps pusilla TaxID=123648 RepID=A0A9P7N7T3_9HYPO|nr:hypothetical protein E4U43_001941 [Claviceps pusilla]